MDAKELQEYVDSRYPELHLAARGDERASRYKDNAVYWVIHCTYGAACFTKAEADSNDFTQIFKTNLMQALNSEKETIKKTIKDVLDKWESQPKGRENGV